MLEPESSRTVALWCALLLQACSLPYPENRLKCDSASDCPSGMRCGANHRCASPTYTSAVKAAAGGSKAAADKSSGSSADSKVETAGTGAGDPGSAPRATAGAGGSGARSKPSCEREHGGCDALVTCALRGERVECGECPSGYRDAHSDGTQCLEIDECSTMTVTCGAAAVCVNMPAGSYSCMPCEAGFRAAANSCVPFALAQFGSDAEDFAETMALGADGALYITGTTGGSLGGTKNAGDIDVFVAKYAPSLKLQWVKQLGSTGEDSSAALAVDSKGNVVVVGYTTGALGQKTQAGKEDAFVAKLDTQGNQLWLDVFGTATDDRANGVVIDESGAAIVFGAVTGAVDGGTHQGGFDFFLMKYDADGKRQLLKQWGTKEDDYPYNLTLKSGNLYVTGGTHGSLDGLVNSGKEDAFVAKLDATGALVWSRQFGSMSDDYGADIAVDDAGNVYVVGSAYASFDGLMAKGQEDIVLAKYDASGSRQWVQLLATSTDDSAMSVHVDKRGAVVIAGVTFGTLGASAHGGMDAVVAKYDGSGSQRWIRQYGDKGWEGFATVLTDTDNNLWLLGNTDNAIEGQKSSGMWDYFLIRYNADGERL